MAIHGPILHPIDVQALAGLGATEFEAEPARATGDTASGADVAQRERDCERRAGRRTRASDWSSTDHQSLTRRCDRHMSKGSSLQPTDKAMLRSDR